MRPYLKKNPSQKRTGGVAERVGLEFKPQYRTKKKKGKRKVGLTGCGWLMPVILATQETEIRRIEV
jgi:hypothetical protein